MPFRPSHLHVHGHTAKKCDGKEDRRSGLDHLEAFVAHDQTDDYEGHHNAHHRDGQQNDPEGTRSQVKHMLAILKVSNDSSEHDL